MRRQQVGLSMILYKRPGRPLQSERLAVRLAEEYQRQVKVLYRQFTDRGRAPFEVRLKPEQEMQQIVEATDQDWQAWRARIGANPDVRERDKDLAQLLNQWSWAQAVRAGLRQPVLADLMEWRRMAREPASRIGMEAMV